MADLTKTCVPVPKQSVVVIEAKFTVDPDAARREGNFEVLCAYTNWGGSFEGVAASTGKMLEITGDRLMRGLAGAGESIRNVQAGVMIKTEDAEYSGGLKLPAAVRNAYYRLVNLGESAISWKCPIEVHIYDRDGRHVGGKADGSFEMGIQGAEVFREGDGFSVFLPGLGEDYRIEVVGTGSGSYDLAYLKPVAFVAQDRRQRAVVPIEIRNCSISAGQKHVLEPRSEKLEERLAAVYDGSTSLQRAAKEVGGDLSLSGRSLPGAQGGMTFGWLHFSVLCLAAAVAVLVGRQLRRRGPTGDSNQGKQ
jgi:hypothetical protein